MTTEHYFVEQDVALLGKHSHGVLVYYCMLISFHDIWTFDQHILVKNEQISGSDMIHRLCQHAYFRPVLLADQQQFHRLLRMFKTDDLYSFNKAVIIVYIWIRRLSLARMVYHRGIVTWSKLGISLLYFYENIHNLALATAECFQKTMYLSI